MELTGTISPDVIKPLLLLLSVWDQKVTCDYRATPAQGNHHWSQRFPFSVCESPKLKLSHTPCNSSWNSGINAVLKIVGKLGMPEKEKVYRFDCLFWTRRGMLFARAFWTAQGQALGHFLPLNSLQAFTWRNGEWFLWPKDAGVHIRVWKLWHL